MPVSFTVADHIAKPVKITEAELDGLTTSEFLARTCPHQYTSAGDILGSSFTKGLPDSQGGNKPKLNQRLSKLNPFTKSKATELPTSTSSPPPIIPSPNGFVHTVISAYNSHHNLVIRPDDVWLAILTQFNFFVNANAELLRANFVAHDGKKQLTVRKQATRTTMDFAEMARQMVGLMAGVISDPALRAWVIPAFSTTTQADRTVGAIIMMSTLKAYFEYVFESCECGIPRVTLEGTKADWEDILGRLEKLKEYGVQTTAWYHLLRPVIARFVGAFDAPDALANKEFWGRIARFEHCGSGHDHYSGWITAFCAFNEDGKWIGNHLNKEEDLALSPEPLDTLPADKFWARALYPQHYVDPDRLVLDDTPFHKVECANVPAAHVEVPVKLSDKGDPSQMDPCTMVAGVVGTMVSRSEGGEGGKEGAGEEGSVRQWDTVQPMPGWWMYTDK
ncbi:hypothetical protein C8R43DRAFT_1235343 [Mycena crocata]|nr:hypothetical protein C8R43DRAFT_1235343 [Mycena crocata]